MATSTLGSGTLVLAGTTSGTTTVTATAVAGTTTLTLPAATDTLVGRATTDTLTNKTLTGAAMNGTLGATTASTVAATTLTTSSTVTHNGGTANGVPYLDGSKVLTTGSALTYSGTTFVNSTNSNAGNFIVNRNISAGAAATSYVISDASAAFTAYTAFGSRSSGYTTSGMLQPSSGGMFTVGMTNGLNIMTLDAYPVNFGTQNVLNMTLDTSGNLGIGETSPGARIDVKSAATDFTGLILNNTSTSGKKYNIVSAGSGSYFDIPTGAFGIRDLTAGATRMVIDTSGNLLVGKTNSTGINAGAVLVPSGGFTLTRTGTSSSDQVIFYRGTAGSETYVGTITTTGTATSYVTSSDYRLKNTIAPMTGALAKVALLKPCSYKWNADGSDGEGFIAHELAEVCPQAVVGEKDAVDTEGNPKYQGIDTSFLVATLTAAIQEQQTLITTLTARITALEGA